MAAVLLLLATMAIPATSTAVTPSTSTAMSTSQSFDAEQIKAAQAQHNWIFSGYVLLLGVTVLFTYFVWSSGNKVQSALQANADARIKEADAKGAGANERATKLENDNILLRRELDANAGRVASLQADAANAKAAQQQVEIALAEQQEKTAIAERARLQMQEAITPRSAGTNGKQNDELALFSGTRAFITFASDADSQGLAGNIAGLLQRAQWNVIGTEAYPFSPLPAQPPKIVGGANMTLTIDTSLFDGVIVMAKPTSWGGRGRFVPQDEEAGFAAKTLCYTLKDSHVECDTFARYPYWPQGVPDDAVWIVIGRKPAAYLRWASDPESQQIFVEDERRSETNSDEDERERSAILARRGEFLSRKPN
jgi:hypothetical protein